MDVTWVKDYGALVAATIAAAVTILNSVLAARRDRDFKTGEWMRQARMPRYVAFVRAANDFVSAIFWQYAEPNPQITGPEPRDKPDYDQVAGAFRHQLAEVTLVGPPRVATAAKLVQYGCWKYEAQLERDPFNFDQRLVASLITSFLSEAREALGIDAGSEKPPDYREWLQAVAKNEGDG